MKRRQIKGNFWKPPTTQHEDLALSQQFSSDLLNFQDLNALQKANSNSPTTVPEEKPEKDTSMMIDLLDIDYSKANEEDAAQPDEANQDDFLQATFAKFGVDLLEKDVGEGQEAN